MSGTINKLPDEIRNNLARQACVRLMRESSLPLLLKAQTEQFIERNVLADCGKVPPNCLKAFMIKTAQKMGLHHVVPYVKKLFRSKVGYNGYFLDSGKLFRADIADDRR